MKTFAFVMAFVAGFVVADVLYGNYTDELESRIGMAENTLASMQRVCALRVAEAQP